MFMNHVFANITCLFSDLALWVEFLILDNGAHEVVCFLNRDHGHGYITFYI